MRVVLSTYCTSTFQRHSTRCLINNLSSYKFSKEIIKWTESWLSNRRQRVLVNGKYSEWLDVTSSVVQGSVLGPLLFGLYINDIDTCLRKKEGIIPKKVVTDNQSAKEMQSIINLIIPSPYLLISSPN